MTNVCLAQIKKANRHFEKYEYAYAIPLYEKVLKRNEKDSLALINLAHSYRFTRNFIKAEEYYGRFLEYYPGSDPEVRFYYGQTLKQNGKPEKAKEQFQMFMIFTDDNELEGMLQLAALERLDELLKDKKPVEVKPVSEINTAYSEFSPVYYKDGIVFASDRTPDLLHFNESGWQGNSYLKILYAKITETKAGTSFSEPELFSSKINALYHDGPATFSREGDVIFFNRVSVIHKGDSQHVNRVKLYFSSLDEKGKWIKPEPFFLNSDEYSVAHPSLSYDGQKLFFSSDMPGGEGGMDIYVCRKEGESWSKPKNLGPDINTPQDEIFPHSRNDGKLVFSSNGLGGIGGQDLYLASYDKKKNAYLDAQNLGVPFNSPADDFGITYDLDLRSGYFSSNRMGSKGLDDIYSFTSTAKIDTFGISGTLLIMDSLYRTLSNMKVHLVNERGEVIDSATTNIFGTFVFSQLYSDKNYLLQLDEDDQSKLKGLKIVLTDQNGNKILSSYTEDGKFTFKLLSTDKNTLSKLEIDDSRLSFDFKGQILTPDKKPVKNASIYLFSYNSKFSDTILTDESGSFTLGELPFDENYKVVIEGAEGDLTGIDKLFLYDHKGNLVKECPVGSDGKFHFDLIETDKNKLRPIYIDDPWIKALGMKSDSLFISEPIYYDYGKYDILPAGKIILNKVAQVLRSNPALFIEISAHTDSRGSAEYNLQLSEKRAQAAVDYIRSRGISSKKITGRGFGEQKLINNCADGVECSEEEHAKNRRTEFRIVISKAN